MFKRNKPTPARDAALGVDGQQYMVVPVPAAETTRRGQGALRTLKRIRYRARFGLAPVIAGLLVWIIGRITESAGATVGSVLGIAAFVTAAVWLFSRVWLDRPIERFYALVIMSAIGVWLTYATAYGVDYRIDPLLWLLSALAPLGGVAPPAAGWLGLRTLTASLTAWLIIGGSVLAAPWWYHFRTRIAPPRAVHRSISDVWDQNVVPHNSNMGGSKLIDVKDVPGFGQTGTLWGPPGKIETANFIAATGKAVSAFEAIPGDVVIDTHASLQGNLARFAWYHTNPLSVVRHWPGPQQFNPETGVATIGVYDDLAPVSYRYYRRGSGPVHDLICGTTDAGKSRLGDQLLAYERHSPIMESYVIDPQEGQSLPVWRDAVAGFANNLAEGLALLRGLEQEMYARNKFLGNVEWTQVVDGVAYKRRGIEYFDPIEGPAADAGMKLIVLTVEEAHVIAATAEGRRILEALAKMARKCGIKLRLMVQVPLLDQLGGSLTLRDAVVGGNVIVFRTGNRLTGQVAFSGNLPVDPVTLPREFPNGASTGGMGYAMTPGARSAPLRSYYLHNAIKWATEGATTRSEPMSDALRDALRRKAETGSYGGDDFNTPAPTGAPAAGEAGTRAPAGAGERAIVAMLMDGQRHSRGSILNETGVKMRTANAILAELVDGGYVIKPEHGDYVCTDKLREHPAAPKTTDAAPETADADSLVPGGVQ